MATGNRLDMPDESDINENIYQTEDQPMEEYQRHTQKRKPTLKKQTNPKPSLKEDPHAYDFMKTICLEAEFFIASFYFQFLIGLCVTLLSISEGSRGEGEGVV